jgi:hypothetical protein
MKKYSIVLDCKETQTIGKIARELVDYYQLPCENLEVKLLPGVVKHLKKRGHWRDFLKYYKDLPKILSKPDFAGQNKREPGTLELYKVMNDQVLIAIKMNQDNF